MNKRQIIGRLGKDAINGVTKNGTEYLSFSVAVDTGYGERKTTEWVDCLMLGRTGVGPHLTKGVQVYVDGDATTKIFYGKHQAKITVQTLKLISKSDDADADADADADDTDPF